MSEPRQAAVGRPLYTPEERLRRDRSPWTIVQGVLAPLQLLAFLVSLWLVLRFLQTGEGAEAATVSVIVKTLFLYAIMVTGAIWEKHLATILEELGWECIRRPRPCSLFTWTTC